MNKILIKGILDTGVVMEELKLEIEENTILIQQLPLSIRPDDMYSVHKAMQDKLEPFDIYVITTPDNIKLEVVELNKNEEQVNQQIDEQPKYLWEFHWDCGRSGDLDGLFVATENEVKDIIGKKAYFGEVLGKHSEIFGTIDEEEITKVELESSVVKKVTDILGETWNGFNPLAYVKYECSRCEDEYSGEDFDRERNLCIYCITELEELEKEVKTNENV